MNTRKMLRNLAALLLAAVLAAGCTSCEVVTPKTSYSNFAVTEPTPELLEEMGLNPSNVYVPYVYTCEITEYSELTGDTAMTGQCMFLPYVQMYYRDVFATGQWTMQLQLRERTVMEDGSVHYGKTPFECRNIITAVTCGRYMRLSLPVCSGRFMDSTKLVDSKKQDNRLPAAQREKEIRVKYGFWDSVEHTTEENAEERLNHLLTLPARDFSGMIRFNGISVALPYSTQRLYRDTYTENGHYFHIEGQVVAAGPDKINETSIAFMLSNYDVVNNVTGETHSISTGIFSKDVRVIRGFW